MFDFIILMMAISVIWILGYYSAILWLEEFTMFNILVLLLGTGYLICCVYVV